MKVERTTLISVHSKSVGKLKEIEAMLYNSGKPYTHAAALDYLFEQYEAKK